MTSSTGFCSFPNNFILEIIYANTGSITNPQSYIVSAKMIAKQEY